MVVQTDGNTRVSCGRPAKVSTPVDDRREPDSVRNLVLELGKVDRTLNFAILYVLDTKTLGNDLVLDVRTEVGVSAVGSRNPL